MSHSRIKHVAFLIQIAANAFVGYLFSRCLAYHFGVSSLKDGFDIAYSVPFVVLNVSGFLFIHAVVTTTITQLTVTNPDEVKSVYSTLLSWMFCIAVLIAAMCAILIDPLVEVLAPGLAPDTKKQTTSLVLMLLPLVPSLGLSAYFSAVLNAHNVPIAAELSQLVARLGAIGWMLWLGSEVRLIDVAHGLSVFSFLILAIQWVVLRKATGLRYRVQFRSNSPTIGVVFQKAITLMLLAVAAQCSWAYMRRLATLDGVGTTAAITYAMAIISPLSLVLGKPVALVTGPEYSRTIAKGERSKARLSLLRTVMASLAVGIFVALGVTVFCRHLIALLYEGGQFGTEAINTTANLSRVLIWGLPAAIVNLVLMMPILSQQNSRMPAIVLGIGYAIHFLATAILFPLYGKYGLVFGYLIHVYAQAGIGCGLLILTLRDRMPVEQPIALAQNAPSPRTI